MIKVGAPTKLEKERYKANKILRSDTKYTELEKFSTMEFRNNIIFEFFLRHKSFNQLYYDYKEKIKKEYLIFSNSELGKDLLQWSIHSPMNKMNENGIKINDSLYEEFFLGTTEVIVSKTYDKLEFEQYGFKTIEVIKYLICSVITENFTQDQVSYNDCFFGGTIQFIDDYNSSLVNVIENELVDNPYILRESRDNINLKDATKKFLQDNYLKSKYIYRRPEYYGDNALNVVTTELNLTLPIDELKLKIDNLINNLYKSNEKAQALSLRDTINAVPSHRQNNSPYYNLIQYIYKKLNKKTSLVDDLYMIDMSLSSYPKSLIKSQIDIYREVLFVNNNPDEYKEDTSYISLTTIRNNTNKLYSLLNLH